jgi:hypothetical protein
VDRSRLITFASTSKFQAVRCIGNVKRPQRKSPASCRAGLFSMPTVGGIEGSIPSVCVNDR